MARELPSRAQVVVVGGGVVGASVAYHLTKRGWKDVVLLERKSLTSGTTWHAAGLITLARPTHGTRAIVQQSLEVFQSLEAETGLGTGFRRTGTLHLAMNDVRWEELLRQASAHRSSDVEVEVVDAARAVELFPLLSPEGLAGALHYPADGRGNATDTTMALAKGARDGGAQIFEQTLVTDVNVRGDRVIGVSTDAGDIEAEYVVNCTGMWGREFGSKAGVALPLQALAHYYVVTEDIPDLPSDMPTIKSSDDSSYVKDDAGKLMVGFFEAGSTPWMSRGIPADAEFATLPENWEHLGPFYEQMVERIPLLADAGIRLFFCGPESFTPDGLYYLGEVPELTNYYAACGFNSVGFLSGPGAGKVLADWIVDGRPPMDLPEVDPRRVVPFQVNRRYLEERVVETLDLAYAMHWPYQQRETMRGIRRSPLHEEMAAAGAVFGEVAGWERANWFAPAGATRATTTPTARPSGSSTGRRNTAQCVSRSGCSTSAPSARSPCRAGTPARCCSICRRTTSTSSQGAPSTPSGSTTGAASRRTSRSRGSRSRSGWCSPLPPPSDARWIGCASTSVTPSSPCPTSARAWRCCR